jgi:ribonucleoside-diphosphate reductase alpha chain
MRRHLPAKRYGWTQKARIGGTKLYLTVNEYPDGTPGEIFVVAAKTGELVQAMLSGWAVLFSAELQRGVSLSDISHSFRHTKFDPSGVVTDDEDVKQASSLFDYVVRHLQAAYAVGAPDLRDKVAAYRHGDGSAPNGRTNGEVKPTAPQPAAPQPATPPQTRLQLLAQETADRWKEPVLLISEPPPSKIGQTPTIPYAVLESRATAEELAAAVERVLPKQA